MSIMHLRHAANGDIIGPQLPEVPDQWFCAQHEPKKMALRLQTERNVSRQETRGLIGRQLQAVRNLGLGNWLRFRAQRIRMKLLRTPRPVELRARVLAFPVYARPKTSDSHVFAQVFNAASYSEFDDVQEPKLIIDCGANVGYSTAYFSSRFPRSTVMAVEPDPDNFSMLCRNTAAVGKRVRPVRAAIWFEPASLRISDKSYRDGGAWARQVETCTADEHGSFRGIDILTLLNYSGFQRISILKMDIEGAEALVFSRNCDMWLSRVDNIAIELHSDTGWGDARRIFFGAIEGKGFSVTERDGLVFCRRATPAG